QTPNYYFPVEPHIRLPFFQFLPLGLRAALAVIIKGKSFRNYAKVKSAVAGVNLLTRAELEKLFPDGKIEEEKLMGLVKSFMVHNL
ncbi:MAG: methyltransferase type 11, partial [Deltaproteobacteria bacterium]|nr:methyltransferase type 11 [Deltaproteobacteria bacterium]